jgi:lipoate-protein ligase A
MWRVIRLSQQTAFENMAIDEAISIGIAEKRSPPTIRFYKWSPSAVSIGYFQKIHDEVDVERCRLSGIDIVRRRTGGGAVYHDSQGEITYSIICPESLFSKDIRASYSQVCSYIISGLLGIGIDPSFRPINDIVVDGKKISGSAQTRRSGVFTQHGTVLYKLDREKMFSLLKPSMSKLKDKGHKSFKDGVACVTELCKATENDLYDALLKSFTEDKAWMYDTLTELERQDVEALIIKYAGNEWNHSR